MQDNQNNNHINSLNNINVSNEGVEDSSEKEILSLRSVFDALNKHPDLFFAVLSFLLGCLCMFLLLFFSVLHLDFHFFLFFFFLLSFLIILYEDLIFFLNYYLEY